MGSPRETVLVAMSGGVDSSVAAALLVREGYAVVGAFMRNGIQSMKGRSSRQGCCGVDDALDARRVADRLDIPFYALDLEEDFDDLIRDFVQAYRDGRTPNPCIECNRRFKMGRLAALAERVGAAAVATGHYARIVERDGRRALARAADRAKDQSYVLFSLSQEALGRTRFPLGALTKPAVRALARDFALPVAEKAESMEICFVPSGDYRDVVRARSPEALRPGPIRHVDGRVLGEHGGTALFTIGQRRGLPSGQKEPLYVTAIDPASATVVVGCREDLRVPGFDVATLTWSGRPPAAAGTVFPGEVMIRAHHTAVPAEIRVVGDDQLRITPQEPESAVTPGQAAVVYADDRVLVGGWIR